MDAHSFDSGTGESPQKVAFEEFKLFYDSTERVVDRRLAANKWNYTTCVATILALVAITDWALTRPDFLFIAVCAIAFLSVMAILFCSLWIGQIRDFKTLNNAKFTILNEMAPMIAFSDHPGDTRTSFEPFDREWKRLQEENGLSRLRGTRLRVLKASNIEYLIPHAFRILFAGIFLILLLYVATAWDRFSLGESQGPRTTLSSPAKR